MNDPSGDFWCEICGKNPGVHNHHRKRRSQGGDNSHENLMRICVGCHIFVHEHPDLSYEKGWLVKSWDDPKPLDKPVEHEHEGKCETCGLEIKATNPKRKKVEGEARRNRATYSIRVPKESREDGAGVMDDQFEW